MNPTIQSIIYLLCFTTSAVCAGLLVRSYLVNRARLILWTALCFVFLALNNLFLVMDVLLLPSADLLPLRQLASLSAVSVLLFGFVWDVD